MCVCVYVCVCVRVCVGVMALCNDASKDCLYSSRD